MQLSKWIFGLGLFLLIGCTEAPHYQKHYSFKNNEWDINVKPEFEVEINDVNQEYDFILTLRTTSDYKYNNLWVFWTTTTPDGQKVREPYEIKISNPDGTWIGDNLGTVIENNLHFSRRKMPQKGKYTFTIEQGITESVIDEVLDIGLTVSEVKD